MFDVELLILFTLIDSCQPSAAVSELLKSVQIFLNAVNNFHIAINNCMIEY